MAERVPDCDAKERLKRLKEKTENENNKKGTKTMVTVWSTWADKKGFSPDIVSYDAEELALKLGKFFWKKERRFELWPRKFAGNVSVPWGRFSKVTVT